MKILGFLIILSIILVIPVADAQLSLGQKAVQKSVEVVINSDGDVHVKHVVDSSNYPKDLELIYGTVSNILVTNEQGEEILSSTSRDNSMVLIQPSKGNSIIEYNLANVLSQKDNLWTWNFSYIQTTSFIMPEEVDVLFVNGSPAFLGEKKGIACHGCQMVLEYSINEPNNIKQVNWEDEEFLVEIRTWSEIENFDFNWLNKKISFEINGNNQFVTTVVPLELLLKPYTILLDEERILYHEFNNNGTHVWLSMRPETSGEITITGTTVIPETSGEITITETTVIPEPPVSTPPGLSTNAVIGIIAGVSVGAATLGYLVFRKRR
ncbi:hypothetical protein HX854_00845 [Marine Group I thaumarchaeote]|uniref:Uncharacterized protein n=1 Tax=Marine Group I thaumarchaeote TaxID=2511932 RepID=A0A7K4N4C3_9ARCH|nr:hypothetical protein [Marine Group I thaumarchaeote]